MSVVLLLWRTRLRSSWRAAVVLVALIGLGGSVALAVGAGARRTASANEVILRWSNSAELAADFGPVEPGKIERAVRSVEGVAGLDLIFGFQPLPSDRGSGFLSIIGSWQDPVVVNRPVMISGRPPTGPTEATVNERAAASLGVAPGDHIEFLLPDASFEDLRPVRLDIVGVSLTVDEVIQDELQTASAVYVPRAFTERHLDRAVWGNAGIVLDRGADEGAVRAALAEHEIFVDAALDEDRARTQAALRPLLVTLAGLAVLAATATVLVAAQALNRLLRRRRGFDRSLKAVGCGTGHLVGADLLYAATVVGGGSLLSVALAVAASPLFPVGPVRRVDVVRGRDVDVVALGGGAMLLALTLIVLVGLGSWRRRTRDKPVSPGRVPVALTSRPAAATGLRLAAAHRGAWMTVTGVAAGLAVVVAGVTFTGSLDRLVGDQSLVGLSWDVGGRTPFDPIDMEQVRQRVEDDPKIERVTGIGYYSGAVNGSNVVLAGLDVVKGSPWPPVVAGRMPLADNEVLVGSATLDQLGVGIGDTITMSVVSSDFVGATATAVTPSFTVVGSAVAPTIGQPGADTPKLGVGILVGTPALNLSESSKASAIVLFDLADGFGSDDLIHLFPQGLPVQRGTPTEWFTSATPAEVSQAEAARNVVWLGLALLAAAIVGTVIHTLLVSVRQRRREYAVLKAIGFTRSQVRGAVLWQSGAIVGLALAAALPTGVAAGRWLWTAFADDLGIVVDPAVPLLLLGGSALAIAALIQGSALVPASLARRTPLAQTLRSE